MSLFDYTGTNGDGRGAEIMDWLRAHPEIKSFCVIDDESFNMGEYAENQLVHTSFYEGRGLKERHVEQAIEILKRG